MYLQRNDGSSKSEEGTYGYQPQHAVYDSAAHYQCQVTNLNHKKLIVTFIFSKENTGKTKDRMGAG